MTRDYAYHAGNNCRAPSSMGVFSAILLCWLIWIYCVPVKVKIIYNSTVDLAPVKEGGF